MNLLRKSSFRETGTMGTLATRAEIGVYSPSTGGVSVGDPGELHAEKKHWDCKSQNPAIYSAFWPENGSQCPP